MQQQMKPTIAIVGGTGALGSGLARRAALAGYSVAIGSRSPDKAAEVAAALPRSGPAPRGVSNAGAAAAGDLVIVTVPFSNQRPILEEIRPNVAGKLVVDTTVPLVPPKVSRVQLPADGCAALAAEKILAGTARVVSAFHNVAAHKLAGDHAIDCDVLVFGDDAKDREVVIGLARDLGLRALHAGPLANSAAAEALTSVLIGINRTYSVDGAGIRITGIGERRG
jgi:NADPH-dependent F420 reductase